MKGMTPLALLATTVGVFLGLSNMPQALKIFQRKSAKDIALSTYLIVECGSAIWVLYGIEIRSIPVIIPNLLGVVATTLVLIGYWRYGAKRSK